MGKALTNKNFTRMHFRTVEFEGAWSRSFGKPELRGSWLIYGDSGSGKTSFNMQLAKYLTNFGKVAYDSIEQGACGSFQMAWNRVGMEEAGSKIMLLDKVTLAELRVLLNRRNSPKIVFIDSLHYWLGFKMHDYTKLLADYPNKLFVFIAHERAGEPKGDMAKFIRYNSDIKVHVEHFKAFVTTRYVNVEREEGIEPYTVWEEGANKYWLSNL